MLSITDEKSSLQALYLRARQEHAGRPSGLWSGFSCFQFPNGLLPYANSPVMHVALHLYRLASGAAYRAFDSGLDVSFRVRVQTLARMTGLPIRTIKAALHRLEQDKWIERKPQTTARGRFAATKIYLLDPRSGRRLETSQRYGLLSSNKYFPFITIPKDALWAIDSMRGVGAKAVYAAALAVASEQEHEIVAVKRSRWLEMSNVSRNTFASGLKYCTRKGLLAYRRGILTLNDPRTGKAPARWKYGRQFTKHDAPKWKFDLHRVEPEQWKATLEKLMRQTFPECDGWTPQTADVACPLCGEHGKFSMNFHKGTFKCFACSKGGGLGKLVQHLLHGTMDDAKKYIQDTIEESERIPV